MYAVIATGGKQYRVEEGKIFKFEKIDALPNASVEFAEVLMIANDDDIKVGKPYLKNAKVTGEVVAQARHPKVEIIKFRRRKHHLKKQGHKQTYTAVKISKIEG